MDEPFHVTRSAPGATKNRSIALLVVEKCRGATNDGAWNYKIENVAKFNVVVKWVIFRDVTHHVWCVFLKLLCFGASQTRHVLSLLPLTALAPTPPGTTAPRRQGNDSVFDGWLAKRLTLLMYRWLFVANGPCVFSWRLLFDFWEAWNVKKKKSVPPFLTGFLLLENPDHSLICLCFLHDSHDDDANYNG